MQLPERKSDRCLYVVVAALVFCSLHNLGLSLLSDFVALGPATKAWIKTGQTAVPLTLSIAVLIWIACQIYPSKTEK